MSHPNVRSISGDEVNLFMSPFSISAALVMLFAGARGETQAEIGRALRLDQIGDNKTIQEVCEDLVNSMKKAQQDGLTLLNTSGVYVHQNLAILPEYKELLRSKFNAAIGNVDFVKNCEKTRVEINAFVKKETRNRIKDLVPEGCINQETRLILVNAIYFKGNWLHKFDPARTSKTDFKVAKGNTKKVNMMFQKEDFRYAESHSLQCSAVELPYAGGRLGMYILLPRAVDGLTAMEGKLNNDSLTQLIDSMMKVEVKLSLPRFKIESSFSLGDTLKAMGMEAMFSEGASDLTGITTVERLRVSAVLHKAFLEVNEDGSEAAAATSAHAGPGSFSLTFEFRVDHPFMVLIRDNSSGLVLFSGRVTNP